MLPVSPTSRPDGDEALNSGHGAPRLPGTLLFSPFGSPFEAIEVQAATMALLMASSWALREHVPLGSGRCVSWLKTNGSRKSECPKTSRAWAVATTDIQPQEGWWAKVYPQAGIPAFVVVSGAQRDGQ
jgi:hypothetical protein